LENEAVPSERHPEITLRYTRFKFPVLAYKFPVPSQKFPVPLRREFCCKLLNLLARQLSKSHQVGGFDEIPFFFPCYSLTLCEPEKYLTGLGTSIRLD